MATKLTPLIKGQKIRIENHQRGTGTVNDWKKEGVHFHKSCNKTKEDFDIIIPLNYPDPPTIKKLKTGKRCPMESMERKVREEIIKVFESRENRDSFMKEVYDYIKENFVNWAGSEIEMITVAERIGRAFGISMLGSPIVAKEGANIQYYIQRMQLPEDGSKYLMKFNFSKEYFQLEENDSDDILIHINV